VHCQWASRQNPRENQKNKKTMFYRLSMVLGCPSSPMGSPSSPRPRKTKKPLRKPTKPIKPMFGRLWLLLERMGEPNPLRNQRIKQVH